MRIISVESARQIILPCSGRSSGGSYTSKILGFGSSGFILTLPALPSNNRMAVGFGGKQQIILYI